MAEAFVPPKPAKLARTISKSDVKISINKAKASHPPISLSSSSSGSSRSSTRRRKKSSSSHGGGEEEELTIGSGSSTATATSTVSLRFMNACGVCRHPLGSGHDIYIYRGDNAFCSDECREKHIKYCGRS